MAAVETGAAGDVSWDDARDVLLDDLSPVDWMVLAARFGAATEPLSLRAFVPRERERVGLDLAPGNPGGLRFTIQAQTATLGWDDCGLLSRMEAPELGYSLVPGDASVLHATGALEVLSGLTIPSPVSAERLPELQGWALRLTADTYGEELSPRDLTVQGQMFSGSVTATRVSGLFTQSCRTYDGREAPALDAPLEPALQKYTQPEVGIESNHARVVETARALGAGARDRSEAAVRAGRSVHAHVRGDLLVQGSALTGLLTGQGASGTRAKLCVALCRALGVPARQAGGLVLAPPDFSLFVPHYWCEVHMGDAGWIPIDPVFDRYNRLPLGYLTFVHLGGMRRIQSLELVAAEDRKEPEMPLLSATSEMLAGCPALSWEFIVEERLIGESHLRPLGRVELSGKSTYAFALETRIDSRPVGKDYVVQAQARLYLDAAGLPAYYVYQENVGGVVTEATCDFSAETGVLHWRGPGQSAELPLVRTPATFILDRNMIGGWAMLCRRLPRAVGETIPLHALVPGQPLELATTASSTRTETLSDGATAWLYDTAPMGETLWIDADGILCRIDNPRAGLTIRRRSTPPGDGTRSTLRYHGAEPPAGDKS
ncbi:transglutaminase domain-containing protein [bacterium]|nr:transglutaminase domain-containing protein [bacterium]